jgi:hypothetical protein
MKETTFTSEEHVRRAQIAAMALGLIHALESGVLDTETPQKLLFRPGIFEKYKDDPEIYRLLNLGEELCWTVWKTLPEFREESVNEIKELCLKILSQESEVIQNDLLKKTALAKRVRRDQGDRE